MLRVKDITASLDFYTRVLGYQLIDKRDFPDAQFSLYFLAYVPAAQWCQKTTASAACGWPACRACWN